VDRTAPDRIHQRGRVDRPAGVHREPGQQGAEPAAHHLDGGTVDLDLERPEDADLHRPPHA
jgi:hypothetical protein